MGDLKRKKKKDSVENVEDRNDVSSMSVMERFRLYMNEFYEEQLGKEEMKEEE